MWKQKFGLLGPRYFPVRGSEKFGLLCSKYFPMTGSEKNEIFESIIIFLWESENI